MATIEPYAAKSVYDPPAYAQAVKVSGAQTILYIAGQVAYTADGGVAHPGDFKAQARACLEAVLSHVKDLQDPLSAPHPCWVPALKRLGFSSSAHSLPSF
jgi:enamine deaminase RidA (YjgF/YER057c/UK114 family)